MTDNKRSFYRQKPYRCLNHKMVEVQQCNHQNLSDKELSYLADPN